MYLIQYLPYTCLTYLIVWFSLFLLCVFQTDCTILELFFPFVIFHLLHSSYNVLIKSTLF